MDSESPHDLKSKSSTHLILRQFEQYARVVGVKLNGTQSGGVLEAVDVKGHPQS